MGGGWCSGGTQYLEDIVGEECGDRGAVLVDALQDLDEDLHKSFIQ